MEGLFMKLATCAVCVAIVTVGGCVGMSNYMAAMNYRDAVEHGQDPLRMACAHLINGDGSWSTASVQQTSVCAQVAAQQERVRQ